MVGVWLVGAVRLEGGELLRVPAPPRHAVEESRASSSSVLESAKVPAVRQMVMTGVDGSIRLLSRAAASVRSAADALVPAALSDPVGETKMSQAFVAVTARSTSRAFRMLKPSRAVGTEGVRRGGLRVI